MARIGIYGWGIVAPRSPDVAAFTTNLDSSDTWLTPFEQFGPSNFLVGDPEFDLETYKPWVDERFPPGKYPQLRQKMGQPTQYAIGAFIQALAQNPGIEDTLRELGTQAQVLVGTGLGDIPTIADAALEYDAAAREWAAFWAAPERNSDRARFESSTPAEQAELTAAWGVPAVDPSSRSGELDQFWLRRSDHLAEFLERLDVIDADGVSGDVESGKLNSIRRKRQESRRLIAEFGCPPPPWLSVSTNLLWNIHNTPAAQISMLGRITGPAYAPVAACSTFGVALHLAMQAIRSGVAKAVVVGAADPAPHPLTVGTFYAARVLSGDRSPSIPLTDLRGTHVAGGSCVWIVGDHDYMSARGFKPLGLELLGVGVTSDADHIITPTPEGPRAAMEMALRDAGVDAKSVTDWDVHATATPGDMLEVENLRGFLRDSTLITARKGTFGHGMGCCGGWELMAQHLGLARGRLDPTPLTEAKLNPAIRDLGFRYLLDEAMEAGEGAAGKLSMGVGGINACVLSKPW
jgi:3-oxoacyl-(acyl-carrier-protein) synthase